MKRNPIREGDEFKSNGNGQVWKVTEAMGFGHGYWCVSVPERRFQTIFKRADLERMQRVAATHSMYPQS